MSAEPLNPSGPSRAANLKAAPQDLQSVNRSRRVDFLGCPLDLLTSAQLLAELREVIDARSGARVIQFVNGNKVAQVREDKSMGDILWRADYVLADGQPIVPMARMLGIRVPERIDGIGLMGKLLALANQHGYRVFLLGAKQPVVEACAARIRRDYPGLTIAGNRNGYFKLEEARDVAQCVRDARPDIVFLGMGSPMKERFANEFGRDLGAAVIQGVGGSFDVMAGLVKRAPRWMQLAGMEWFFRVLQEPRRMFWRYARTNVHCLWVFFEGLCMRLVSTPPEKS